MSEISLLDLEESHLSTLETWFQDSELKTRLGGMLPLPQWFDLAHTASNRFAWMAYTKKTPVGIADLEVYPDSTASISLLVNPDLRNYDYGRQILNLVLSQPEVADIEIIEAMIEADNMASLRCFKSIGFTEESSAPDADGFVRLLYTFK